MRYSITNIFGYGVLIALASIGVWSAGGVAGRLASVHAAGKAVPVTVVNTENYYNDSGNLTWTAQRKFEVRSDGSTVDFNPRIPPPPGLDLPPTRIISNAQNGTRTTVDDVTQSTITYKIGFRAKVFDSSCGAPPGAETVTILGYPVIQIGKQISGSGALSTISYRAPTLGCVELRRQVNRTLADGSIVTLKASEAISVTPGEPDAADFSIPGNYTERLPSDAYNELQRRFPNVIPKVPPVTSLDDAYRTSHQ